MSRAPNVNRATPRRSHSAAGAAVIDPIPAGLMAHEIETRFRLLTESMSDLVCEIDETGHYRYLSPNYETVLGWDVAAVLGTQSLDHLHPDDRAGAGEEIRRAFATGYGRREVRVRRGDGQWRWQDCIGRSYVTESGEARAILICRDVTERLAHEAETRAARDMLEDRVRRRTSELEAANRMLQQQIAERLVVEEQLRTSEARLRTMLENVPDVLTTIDPDGTILYVHMPTGMPSPPDAVGQVVYDFIPVTQHPTLRAVIEQVLRTGQPAKYEAQFIETGDWYANCAAPVYRDEKVVAIALVSTNVTAQKRAEAEIRESQLRLEHNIAERSAELAAANKQMSRELEERNRVERELRESEERFRAIAETNPVPLLISRVEDGRILYANQRLTTTLGLPVSELLNRTTTEFYGDPAARTELIRAMNQHGYVKDYDLQIHRPDGVERWLWVSNQRIAYQNQDAILTGVLDITERRQQEERLRQDQKILKQLLELQDRDRQLIAYEIHDGLVQELTGVLMFLESARQTADDEGEPPSREMQTAVDLLRSSISEARRLINGLRPPILDELGVVPAIEHLIAELASKADMDVELDSQVEFDRLSPRLENTIYRVVQEALTNVHRHSQTRTAWVQLVQRDDQLEITVRDQGIGFDPGKVPQNRFGLTGVQERARLFGGRAEIESAPGKGTTIHVELPINDMLETSE